MSDVLPTQISYAKLNLSVTIYKRKSPFNRRQYIILGDMYEMFKFPCYIEEFNVLKVDGKFSDYYNALINFLYYCL